MKTSSELPQQAFIRKLTYFGLVLVLFTAMTFSGRFVAMIRGAQPGASRWTVSGQARALQLNESELGEADLAGSTIRLALSGSRGFAITMFWLSTIEEQKKHKWNEVDFLVSTITKLQPHFLTPWLFQSWNLAYNVSVESDRVRDKYFYISRGIELLADGERVNRAHGVDENGNEYTLGNPDMRFWVGFYYMNKFGTSDEQNTLRSLLQMSCINPSKRDPNLLRDRRSVNRQAFLEFVRQNPMLCRRLRDYLRCKTPEDVIDFLADNAKVPTRYEEVDRVWVLKRRPETQFPVVPDYAPAAELAPPRAEWEGNFDSFHCAWAWHLFSQEPLPPVIPGKPSGDPPPYDHLRFRMPRSPAGIIFRQYPQRDISYVAERLQKEGWFDDSGWEVDQWRQTGEWFPETRVVVAEHDPRYSSQAAWQRAYEGWKEHGRIHGLSLTPAERENLLRMAKKFEEVHGQLRESLGTTMTREELGDEMYANYDAHRQLFDLSTNLQMTNFEHFLYRSETESNPATVRMRRLFFEARRLRDAGRQEPAIQKYEEAFAALVGDPAKNQNGLLEDFPNFRHDTIIQEELIEKEVAYLDLVDAQRGPRMRSILTAKLLLGFGALTPTPAGIYGATLFTFFSRPGELPWLFVGPLTGSDAKGEPWMHPANVYQVYVRLGRIRVMPQAPVAPGGMMARPPQ